MQKVLTEASIILHEALMGAAYFDQVIIVVPGTWSEERCGTPIQIPTGNTPYKVAEKMKSHQNG